MTPTTEELTALLAACTPGEWVWDARNGGIGPTSGGGVDVPLAYAPGFVGDGIQCEPADARLLALAPELAREVVRLRGEVSAAKREACRAEEALATLRGNLGGWMRPGVICIRDDHATEPTVILPAHMYDALKSAMS